MIPNPTDLRIGNYLHDNLTGELLRVSDIVEDGFTCYVINRDKFPLPVGWQAVGIPLTPEVIAKCTFAQSWINDRLSKNMIRDGSGHYEGYSIWLKRSAGDINVPVLIECNYLHELQNAIFAIFKQELKYTS